LEELINNLESLGFTNYESRVFHALFRGQLMTATEVAKEAKIPRSSAYDILKSFALKGICNEINTSSVIKYELIDPQVVQDKIEKEINDTYKKKMSNLKTSFEVLRPLMISREELSNKVDVELIKGFNKHRNVKLNELLKNADSEILIMTRMEGYVDSELNMESVNFMAKGGKVRSLYELSNNFKLKINGKWEVVDKKGLIDLCREFEKQGEEIKLSEHVPQNMFIFDTEIVYISLVDPTIKKYNRSDIIIKNKNFADSMTEYFNLCWKNAKTIEEIINQTRGNLIQ
jgi:sugar-specific transcriptional regulator TrmB